MSKRMKFEKDEMVANYTDQAYTVNPATDQEIMSLSAFADDILIIGYVFYWSSLVPCSLKLTVDGATIRQINLPANGGGDAEITGRLLVPAGDIIKIVSNIDQTGVLGIALIYAVA